MVDKLFAATKAFIVHNGKILVVRESSKYKDGTNAGRFDIVGGRVEPGQRFDESLLREIEEETSLKVKVGKPFHADEWRPCVKGEKWQVIATFFECFAETDKVKLSEDHDEFKWIKPEEYKEHNLIPNLNSAFESYLERKK
ncbi:MAG: NUDIX domain-containing protein [Nanoarchaeota archaeon]|nr:NUDIX domain-containing protein [Nanoarchaeota archaeon]